ncbi:MAG: lipopolysaccharide core heptose(I) kinase RfaP [Pseudomonadales bacterium]|nr:lipopolysaccharide core heptose(I) kinase RfaP [Pseudomonadales bacterium]
MQQYANGEFREAIGGDDDLIKRVDGLTGEIYRELEARRTFRFHIRDQAYFAKLHYGVGWPEIFKNLFQGRFPVLGAANEWRALKRLEELGIPSIEPVAWASKGFNPARRQSCIVTKALENTRSLEELVKDDAIDFRLRLRLTRRLAEISSRLHRNGINHRDYYICHFLADMNTLDADEPHIYLIDLHRAQVRSRTPRRWLVKDLGGLLFSAMEAGIGVRDVLRFVRDYSGKPLRRTLEDDRVLWRDVVRRARRLYLQDNDRVPSWVDRLTRE